MRKYLNFKPYYTKLLVYPLFGLVLIQIFFWFFQSHLATRSEHSVSGVLKESYLISDPYTLSQVLTGFERSNLLKCLKIKNLSVASSSDFYQSSNQECSKPSLSILLNGEHVSSQLTSSNGSIWQISYTTVNGDTFYWFLWFTRVMSVFFICLIIIWFENRKITEKRLQEQRLQNALELNKLAEQVAHDIRSPLSVLNLVIQRSKELPTAHSDLLKAATSRIQLIANELLDFKKKQNSKSQPHTTNGEIEQIILQIIKEKELITNEQIQFTFERLPSKKDSKISTESKELSRIMSNLIDNSIEALEGVTKTKKIEIQILNKEKNSYSIIVRDNGKGIEKSVLPLLFKRGASFGKEHSNKSGTGLGLYYCQAKISEWGGSCKIDSTVGEFTEIELNLKAFTS